MISIARQSLERALVEARSALQNQKGETITETLVALLIGGLALLMLAVVIATSSKLVLNSKTAMEGYYEHANVIAEQSSPELGEGTVTLRDALTKEKVAISPKKGAELPGVKYIKEEDVLGQTIVLYWVEDGTSNSSSGSGDSNNESGAGGQ